MTAIGPAEIKALLPHRTPMLLIDRVTELIPGESLCAQKAISLEAPWYNAIDGADYSYPPLLLVESLAQAAAILITGQLGGVTPGEQQSDTDSVVPVFGSMTSARFGPPVLPGDLLEHSVHLQRELGNSAIFSGSTRVRGTVVLSVEKVVMALRPGGQLSRLS